MIILAPALVKKKIKQKFLVGVNTRSFLKSTYSTDLSVYLRVLVPLAPFLVVKKKSQFLKTFTGTLLIWPGELLDTLALILYSNPIFFNTKLFDFSIFINKASYVLYYIFKVPLFSTWLVVFSNYSHLGAPSSKNFNLISTETLFYSMSWLEREASELFGIFFFNKQNNRKLITDYFFKVYPMLKWVPSIGFSEVYVSSEGFFTTRKIKVFNSTLS